MTSDAESLRLYAELGDQAAFAEVVCHHVDWVYSTALRLTAGDTHLAEDVTQVVFSDLARKAGMLSRHPALGGWLHTATRYAAAKAVSRESARRAREQEAFAMQNQTTTTEISWEHLQPLLDEGIGRLGEADRNLVVLRFFEGRSHRELGELLGLSEDTARKRVERAVEKLRVHFSRRGVVVSAGLLAEAVTANAVSAAPASVAEGVTSTALASAVTAPTGWAILAKIFITMTTTTKIILGAAVIVIVAASYQLFSPGETPAEPKQEVPTPLIAKPAMAAQVAAPSQAPVPKAPAATLSTTQTPLPGSAANPPSVQPNIQEAMAMMQPMKQMYADVYQSLMNANDIDGALEKMNALGDQLDKMQAKAVGTPLEPQLAPAVKALKLAQEALQHGDVAGARKIIEGLNQQGPKIQSKIEQTAGVSFDQAAKDAGAASTPTTQN